NVINVSITGPQSGGLSAAERTALQQASDNDVVVVAASGNEGDNLLDYPAAVPGVISVGAVNMNSTKASYSSYGQGEGNKGLDIVAPGGDPSQEGSTSVILQQTYATCTSATDFTTFPDATPCWGTSMATAHVSGVAALIRSRFPSVSANDVRTIL